MPILVMKFGGTSVANLDRIRRAAKRVGVEVAKGCRDVVHIKLMNIQRPIELVLLMLRSSLPRMARHITFLLGP